MSRRKQSISQADQSPLGLLPPQRKQSIEHDLPPVGGQRRASIQPKVPTARRMSKFRPNSFQQEKTQLQEHQLAEPEPKTAIEQPKSQYNLDRERSSLLKFSRYLIQLPSEKCTVAFYHHVPNIAYREVVDGIQAALIAAYRPPNSIVSVELVPLMARNAEYYTENRWVVEMVDEELASLLYRSDVYIRTHKVNVMSLSQALSTERSREFRDQLRLRMQKVSGPNKPAAAMQIPQQGRRMSRVTRVLDFIEDPKTAVQQQFQ